MFRGFFALFVTGLIFRPMLLLGGLTGIVLYIGLESETLKRLYSNYNLYLLFLFIASLYVFFFKKTYLENGYDVDWKETIKTMVGEFLMLSFCFIMGMLLASFFDFSDVKNMQDTEDLTYAEQLIDTQTQEQAKELQQNYDALLKTIK